MKDTPLQGPDIQQAERRRNGAGSSEHEIDGSASAQSRPCRISPDGTPSREYLTELAAFAGDSRLSYSPNAWIYLPRIATYRKLRQYNLENIARELDVLSDQLFKARHASKDDLDRLRVLLHEQVVAMQDIEYIYKHLTSNEQDDHSRIDDLRDELMPSFRSRPYRGWTFGFREDDTSPYRLHTLLKRMLPTGLSWTASERQQYEFELKQKQLPKQDTVTVHLIASFVLSLCSGATIIVPMIVMSFGPSQTKSLITTSLAVLLFGFVLSAVVRMRSSDVFLATATYAAVLVVFVGSSGSANGETS